MGLRWLLKYFLDSPRLKLRRELSPPTFAVRNWTSAIGSMLAHSSLERQSFCRFESPGQIEGPAEESSRAAVSHLV